MDVVEHIEISVTKAQDKAKDPFSVTSFGFNIYQNKCFREEEFLTLEQYQTCVWGILEAARWWSGLFWTFWWDMLRGSILVWNLRRVNQI